MKLLNKTLLLLFFTSCLCLLKPEQAITLTDANYKEQIENGSWFMMFTAPWCGQCRRLKQTWSKLAEELKDDGIKFAIIDTAKEKHLQTLFAAHSFPTLILLQDGKMYEFEEFNKPEAIKEFARGGYKSAVAEEIPKEPSTVKSWIKSLKMMAQHFGSFLRTHPITAYSLLGVLIAFLAMSCWLCISLMKPEKDFLIDVDDKKSKRASKLKVQ